MGQLSLRARCFWAAVVTIGGSLAAVSLVESVRQLSAAEPQLRLLWLGLLISATVAQLYRVWLPNPRRPLGSYAQPRACGAGRGRALASQAPPERETTSIASAVYVFALLGLPTALAVGLAALASSLAAQLGGRRRWYQRMFNVAQLTSAVAAASVCWQLGRAALPWPLDLLLLPAVLLVYFLVNSGAVATIVALVEGLPVRHVWLRGRRGLLASYLLLMAAGALLWVLWQTGSLFPAGLAVVFGLVATYRSFKHSVMLQQQTIDALANLADLMDQRDYYTHQHSLRVGQYAERVAARMGLPQDECWLIFLCGRLHDIGKCAVSNDVLLKPGPLNAEERAEMSRHAAVGGQMLEHFAQFRVGASYVRAHHEWYDGNGYPDGLARSQIPVGARIIAVVDAFDAMTTDRPYRSALPAAEARRRLLAGAGSQWDPRVVQAFLPLIDVQPPAAESRAATPARLATLQSA